MFQVSRLAFEQTINIKCANEAQVVAQYKRHESMGPPKVDSTMQLFAENVKICGEPTILGFSMIQPSSLVNRTFFLLIRTLLTREGTCPRFRLDIECSRLDTRMLKCSTSEIN